MDVEVRVETTATKIEHKDHTSGHMLRGDSTARLDVRTFSAPQRYVQGEGALDQLGPIVALRHQKAVVLVDEFLADALEPILMKSMAEANVVASMFLAAPEVTEHAIHELAQQAKMESPSVVVAVGGGKTLDIGKGVSRQLGISMVSVPTIASNDGPTARNIAVYNDAHVVVATQHMDHNPEAVVVDTALINRAPARFLRAGIGDALAKKFESAATSRSGGLTSHGSRPLAMPNIIASGSYSALLAYGEKALDSLGSERPSEELERVVEAVVLMSGLAFENGGLSVAHAVTRGLQGLPGANSFLHGYHVAYGLLVQLSHEANENELREVERFNASVGLPCRLADLGVEYDATLARQLAEAALSAHYASNSLPRASVETLMRAIAHVEGHDLGPVIR